MAETWTYDERSRRYRSDRSGRFLSHDDTVTLRDTYNDASIARIRQSASDRIGNAAPGSDAWQRGVDRISRDTWREIEKSQTAHYMLGRGGRNAMTAGDKATVQRMLHQQRGYWDRMITDARTGKIKSVDGLLARVDLYSRNGTEYTERGRAAAFAINLPAMPGDGSTECRTRCRCAWQYREFTNRVEVTWRATNDDATCDTCKRYAAEYAPYTVHRAVPQPVEGQGV